MEENFNQIQSVSVKELHSSILACVTFELVIPYTMTFVYLSQLFLQNIIPLLPNSSRFTIYSKLRINHEAPYRGVSLQVLYPLFNGLRTDIPSETEDVNIPFILISVQGIPQLLFQGSFESFYHDAWLEMQRFISGSRNPSRRHISSPCEVLWVHRIWYPNCK